MQLSAVLETHSTSYAFEVWCTYQLHLGLTNLIVANESRVRKAECATNVGWRRAAMCFSSSSAVTVEHSQHHIGSAGVVLPSVDMDVFSVMNVGISLPDE